MKVLVCLIAKDLKPENPDKSTDCVEGLCKCFLSWIRNY